MLLPGAACPGMCVVFDEPTVCPLSSLDAMKMAEEIDLIMQVNICICRGRYWLLAGIYKSVVPIHMHAKMIYVLGHRI